MDYILKLEAEIARLTAELIEGKREAEYLANLLWERHYKNESPNFEKLNTIAGVVSQIDNMVAGLIEERDIIALACAAAAAMEMRERSASVTVDLGPRYDGRPVHYHIPENVQSVIRALPIPTDAQEALGKLLAKAFSEGLEAATDKVAHDYVCKAIMQIENPYHALLNDGGRDE